MSKPRPVIVVTGANGGVGFGICQRLLFQLSEVSPLDAHLRPAGEHKQVEGNDNDDQLAPCDGLTLILACRNAKRAETAKEKLLRLLDGHVAKLQMKPGYDGHAETFRSNLRIEIYELDLGMLSTVTKFASEVAEKHGYVSHLICNAGVATFNRIDWFKAAKQFLVAPFGAVTTPMFYSETWGEVSLDGYGWVWQCNVFGHYFLFRELQSLLLSPKYPASTRIVWTSSLKALPQYDPEDWQLKLTQNPYSSSKYQTELIATHLDRLELRKSPEEKRIRHFISHPSVCHTNIDLNLIPPILHHVKFLVFHLVRLLGSIYHPISFDKGALAAVWLSIISLSSISTMFVSAPVTTGNGTTKGTPRPPVKFGSCCSRWGDPLVGLQPIECWDAGEAERLMDDIAMDDVQMTGTTSQPQAQTTQNPPSDASNIQPTIPIARENFRDIQVKVHIRRPERDSWVYMGRGLVSQEVHGHSSRVVVRTLNTNKLITQFGEGSDLQAEKRGNFVVIGCVEDGGVVSWSLNALNNSETLRLLASIELACYKCKNVLTDPRMAMRGRRKIERIIKEDRRRRHKRRKEQDALIDAFAKQDLSGGSAGDQPAPADTDAQPPTHA
ncbi:3-keto-steroid reductase [Marasmius sp. AFHP31]|nr:3-keto-steroid reductase [Marasmius sp. AFHP31]